MRRSLMVRQQIHKLSSNRAPLFYGTNYTFWSLRMKTYLSALGYDIWKYMEDGYTIHMTHLMDKYAKRESKNNSKSLNFIYMDWKILNS